jgi:NADPH-dependent 2,4-dienoyl-CoA reductase/sulfur reductase-like enzyme/nitrite reductase/ring-hydroxylating ferredoxin subunit
MNCLMNDQSAPPDLTRGIDSRELADDAILLGRVGDEEVILVKRGAEIFSIGAHCMHYKGPLAKGLVVGDTVRCPWHHACFSLRTGEPVRAPALDRVACWKVEREGDTVFVRKKLPAADPKSATKRDTRGWPSSVVIVGGGAAGLTAAEMLRREGYDRPITMLSSDDSPPCDRPNLSKDFLAGTAQEDWIPLQPPDFYRDQDIALVLNARVSALDLQTRLARLDDGRTFAFGALLIATGAEPVRLTVPGADQASVHYLRTFADSKAIVAEAASAKRAVVIGASFIGLEVAASLRTRGIAVQVVSPEARPMERTLGPDAGGFVQRVHESHGVRFHLGRTVTRIEGRHVSLNDGTTLDADTVVVGIGVRPRLALAEEAQLTLDHGIVVNEYLETSAPGVFAAGDVARWPDPHSGERIRVEHWVVAERQGQTAARNMLGSRERFEAVPFFWSQHYDVTINYVGHAESWDAVDIDGRLEDNDCTITYRRGNRRLAVATVFRDRASLEAEAEMERETRRDGRVV